MELEVQLRADPTVGILLVRQANVQSNRLSAGFAGAAVGSLHDPRPAAGSHNEAVLLIRKCLVPLGKFVGEGARLFVIARHLDGGAESLFLLFVIGRTRRARLVEQRQGALRVREAGKSCRAEEDDSVLYPLAAEARQWFRVFGKDSQHPAIGAV